jgi:hypothetical protein
LCNVTCGRNAYASACSKKNQHQRVVPYDSCHGQDTLTFGGRRISMIKMGGPVYPCASEGRNVQKSSYYTRRSAVSYKSGSNVSKRHHTYQCGTRSEKKWSRVAQITIISCRALPQSTHRSVYTGRGDQADIDQYQEGTTQSPQSHLKI